MGGIAISSSEASAVIAVEHGFGHTWDGDGHSWLGSHRLADGNLGLCLQVNKLPPEGNDLSYVDGNSLGWFTDDDSARLAYLARNWLASSDAGTAAATQLATWTITGLNGHDQEWYAKRANGSAGEVLDLARNMLDKADASGGASRSVRAEMLLSLPEKTISGSTKQGSVRAEIIVDFLGGGFTALPPGAHSGTITLHGAVFDDGSTTAAATNGTIYAMTPTGTAALSDITAEVVFDNLPYGHAITVAQHPGGIQSLLVPPAQGTSARASAHLQGRSTLPFQPRVQTQTSSQTAQAGTRIHDELTLSLSTSAGTLSEWGVYPVEPGIFKPVPVTIESSLLGPYNSPITPAETIPQDAPVVCTVETTARQGPGSYSTPECTLPAGGYYVWVEKIDPQRTPVSEGGGSILAWVSEFGERSEVSFVAFPPTISTTISESHSLVGDCIFDTLHVTNVNPASKELEIHSILVGPLTEKPEEGFAGNDLKRQATAGNVSTKITANGDYKTACITLAEPGHYFFIYESDGSAFQQDGTQIIPPFTDQRAHASEMTTVTAPPPPERLPLTGLETTNLFLPLGAGSSVFLGALLLFLGRRNRRHNFSMGAILINSFFAPASSK